MSPLRLSGGWVGELVVVSADQGPGPRTELTRPPTRCRSHKPALSLPGLPPPPPPDLPRQVCSSSTFVLDDGETNNFQLSSLDLGLI